MTSRTHDTHDFFAPSHQVVQLAENLSIESLVNRGMKIDEATKFLRIRKKFLEKKALDFTKIIPPEYGEDDLFDFEDIAHIETKDLPEIKKLLSQLIVLQFNGGTGEEMGFKGPKSSVPLSKEEYENQKDVDNPLNLILQHIWTINQGFGVDIPIFLLNSPATHDYTLKLLEKTELSKKLRIFYLIQTLFPICLRETLEPVPQSNKDSEWHLPGTAEAFYLLAKSEDFQRLKQEGKKFMFCSNIENIGRSIDPKILKHFESIESQALLEVTERLSIDTYGGILVHDNQTNRSSVLEIHQIPYAKRDSFSAIDYPYYNTNNIWIKLEKMQEVFSNENQPDTHLILRNTKVKNDTVPALTIQNPASQAIFAFPSVQSLIVPRTRYIKIVNTEDLLAIQSEIYQISHGVLIMNPLRIPASTPLIKLGDAVSKQYFKRIDEYEKRIKSIPKMLELEHLTIAGDVTIGANVTLKGTVIIVAETGSRIDIPNGTVLENKIVTGQLNILKY